MVISQFGKIIRIDTKTIRAAGRSTQGVKLLNLEAEDKVAAAVIIPPKRSRKTTRARCSRSSTTNQIHKLMGIHCGCPFCLLSPNYVNRSKILPIIRLTRISLATFHAATRLVH